MKISAMMRAMVLEKSREPLRLRNVAVPAPQDDQILIRVNACGVCRTDLHVVDGDLTNPKLPLIPGHEIVGVVIAVGARVSRFRSGDRIGVPWLGHTDGTCPYCRSGRENLCDHPGFTGYTQDGGYAEYAAAYADFCFRLPDSYEDVEAAPLLCAGLIGYRSYRMISPSAQNIGLYGFGASAHIIAQIAVHQGKRIYAFTRPGDENAQKFARRLGAVWAGDSTQTPPDRLDAAILFAPVGELVPAALQAVVKGGVVVCAGIHMSDIPAFPYKILWEERIVRSVANLTRQDGEEFFAVAPQVPVKTQVQTYPLIQANQALDDLRAGKIEGAAVLIP